VANSPSLGPVTLEGRYVRLEPLHPRHRAGLAQAADDARIWPWMSQNLSDPATLQAWLESGLTEAERGTAYVFVVMLRGQERVVGSTRYLDIRPEHRGVEIGWTWYHPSTWGTMVNPEAKWLLLQHAFEDWGALRVQLKTDHENLRSQAAIKKLGAQYEGTLRHDRIRPDGTLRNSVYFSILAEEWPAVKAGLLDRLDRKAGP
jgi:RimJ/RimL family protein N-acetyltransferase